MRTLTITLLPSGRIEFTPANIFSMEHKALRVTIDYSLVDYELYIKRAEVSGLTVPMIYEVPTGNTLTFDVERASLAGETVSIQPIAYLLDGIDITQEIKWSIIRYPVNDSLNLVESGEVPPSMATQILERIDAVEDLADANALAITDLDTTKMETTGSNSNVSKMAFQTTLDQDVIEGQVMYNTLDKTFHFGVADDVTNALGEDIWYPRTRNTSASNILNGDLVMFTGAIGNSGVITIAKCSTNVALAGAIMGVATQDIPIGSEGKVSWFGIVHDIQTDGANYGEVWNDGDMLYNSSTVAGGLSKVKPLAPKNSAFVGVVVNAHASSGQLLIRPMFFPQLGQLSNVALTNPISGDVIMYDATTGVWKNDSRLSIPRWDDMNFPATTSMVGSNAKPDYDYTNMGLLFPQNNTAEIAYIICQMPHTWVEGTDIFPHVHGIQAANQQATFVIQYKWYNLGDVEPASWSTYTMNSYVFPYTSGRIGQIVRNATPISGVGKTISSILKIKLYRNDNVYVGDFLVDQFDIHIQKDGMGSQTVFDKT